jgi:methylated-DNA-[protein]-cysteine S-methyltransferase
MSSEAENNSRKLAEVQRQVNEYAQGARRISIWNWYGWPGIRKAVWMALGHSFGATTSYGAVAKRIGQPNAARAVGAVTMPTPSP